MAEAIQLADTDIVRRALRLVSTRNIQRADWLAIRRTGIGGSDAAASVGLSPYKSQLELWLEKTGRDGKLEKPDPNDTSHPTYWGTTLEPIVAASYTLKTRRRVRRVNAVLQHPLHHFMLANLDREIVGQPDVQILECKTAGEFGARLWRDGVPEYVQLQVQHQLAVTGQQAADLAVLICGQRLEVYRIERDDELIARLITLEARFWQYVVEDTPPPADGSESSDRALRSLYPGRGTTIDWSGDSQMSSLFSDLVAIKAHLREQEAEAERLRQTVQQAMGDASEALFENGRVSFKRSKECAGVDIERLLAEHTELASTYAITRPGVRRFRICE